MKSKTKSPPRKNGHAKEPVKHATSARSQSHPIHSQSAVQDNLGGNVRHIRQIRRHTTDPSGNYARDERNRFRRLRGHFRRQERVRSLVRLQRLQSVFGRSLSSAREDRQENGHREGERAHSKDKTEIWNLIESIYI